MEYSDFLKQLRALSPRALMLTAGVLVGSAFLAGCNTVEGAGEDIEAAGDAISDEAEDNN